MELPSLKEFAVGEEGARFSVGRKEQEESPLPESPEELVLRSGELRRSEPLRS